MKPYKPSNKINNSGIILVLLSSILGGVVIGGITFIISLLVYLIIFFPLGMGFGAGMINSAAIKKGKIRNRVIAASFGALTGLMVYGTVHTGEYLYFKQIAKEELIQEFGELDNSEVNQIVNIYLEEETGSKGIIGFLKFSAKRGVSIGRFGSNGFTLNETWTYIYWLIEFGIIEVITIMIASNAVYDPFCEKCNQWYQKQKRIGNVNHILSQDFISLIQQENLVKAGELINPALDISTPSLEIYYQECPQCKNNDVMVRVKKANLDSKGNLYYQELNQGMISYSKYSEMMEQVVSSNSEEIKEKKDNLDTD